MKERLFRIEFLDGQTVDISIMESRHTPAWVEAAGRAEAMGPVRSITLLDEPAAAQAEARYPEILERLPDGTSQFLIRR